MTAWRKLDATVFLSGRCERQPCCYDVASGVKGCVQTHCANAHSTVWTDAPVYVES